MDLEDIQYSLETAQSDIQIILEEVTRAVEQAQMDLQDEQATSVALEKENKELRTRNTALYEEREKLIAKVGKLQGPVCTYSYMDTSLYLASCGFVGLYPIPAKCPRCGNRTS